MKPKLVEVEAVYCGEMQRWSDTVVARIKLSLDGTECTAKGIAQPDELINQLTYRFYGRWTMYRDKKQFLFTTFVQSAPHGEMGTIRYLQQAPHVGLATARLLWEKFKGDAVRIARESPEVITAATRLNEDQANEIAAFLRHQSGLESCSIELMDLIGNRGFPRDTIQTAIRKWGNKSHGRIKKSPYILLALKGIGFKRADALYLEIGLPPAAIKRQALCVTHALQSESSGDTWQPSGFAVDAVRGNISGAQVEPVKAIKLARRARLIASRRDGEDKLWFSSHDRALAERRLAQYISKMMLTKKESTRGNIVA